MSDPIRWKPGECPWEDSPKTEIPEPFNITIDEWLETLPPVPVEDPVKAAEARAKEIRQAGEAIRNYIEDRLDSLGYKSITITRMEVEVVRNVKCCSKVAVRLFEGEEPDND